MPSLAVKYRPQDFESCAGQQVTIKILEKQLETNSVGNIYLFCGSSGCGKTTIGRIMASKINKGHGQPIEIDAASNNGVDAVRAIVEDAKLRSVDSEYKIYIIDECHMLTTAGWNAFLKCLEEPPKYTIFIFCTTAPEKIPDTILNRVQRFNLSKIPTQELKNRLLYICEQEQFINYAEACDYISKISNGGARDAIATLEKCAGYNRDLSIKNVLECLGNFSYDNMFNFTCALLNSDEQSTIQIIENYYNAGNDLKNFVENYLDFCLDLTKYCIFRNLSCTKIPSTLEQRCIGYSNIPDILDYSNNLVEKVLEIKTMIKYDPAALTTVEAMFIKICRGI